MGHYANKIKTIYESQGVVDADFSLQEVGGVHSIAYWNTGKLGAQPTLASIDSQISDSEIESCQRWKIIRNERDKLLKESDYLILADAPITTEKKEEWTTYRQSLRDIPQTFSNPDDVTYPDKPE